MEPEIIDPAPAPTPAETITQPENESNAIRTMRAAIDAANKAKREAETQLKDIAARLKTIEDSELSEIDRLKREVDELKPLRDSHGKFNSRMEALYAEELASVPEEKRSAIETLSASGDWSDRLEAIKAARVLIAPAPPAGTPSQPMGAPTAPARANVTPQPERLDPTKLSWSEAIRHPIKT